MGYSREAIQELVNAYINAGQDIVACPTCSFRVKVKFLLRHHEKLHSPEAEAPKALVHAMPEATPFTTDVPTPRVQSEQGVGCNRSRILTRSEVKAIAQQHHADASVKCPTCRVSVKAKGLVRHFDKNHTFDDSPASSGKRQDGTNTGEDSVTLTDEQKQKLTLSALGVGAIGLAVALGPGALLGLALPFIGIGLASRFGGGDGGPQRIGPDGRPSFLSCGYCGSPLAQDRFVCANCGRRN
jgi:hypothetical protein